MKQVIERFVYLVQAGSDSYKVGIAGDVLSRLKGIQNGNPESLQLIVAIYSEDAPTVERGLHKWLAEHKADGGREWFHLTPPQALGLVARMTELSMTADVSKYLALRNLISRQTALEKKFDDLLNMDVIAKALHDERERMALELEQQNDRIISTKSDEDELFNSAAHLVRASGKASTSMLQRKLRVGYARAARILDDLEKAGIVGKADGARPREVIS